MVEIRTSLTKFIETDAELFYGLEFDENQKVVFFSLPLSDLSWDRRRLCACQQMVALTSMRMRLCS